MILEGETIRDSIREELKGKGSATLAIIQVGNNPASNSYIKRKINFGKSIGVQVLHKRLPEEISEEELLREISFVNQDRTIQGLIVQLPLPSHINQEKIMQSIAIEKDADGMNPNNRDRITPATTRGILTILSYYGIQIGGKKVLVIGRSKLVGIPTALALIKKDATVTIAHSQTEDLKKECLNADIIICAVGKPRLITKEMTKKGQVIIDVGINNMNGNVVGDVAFDEVKDIVAGISPVPGGVGPLTVASLFQNLFDLL